MRRAIAIVVVLALIAGGAYYILHDSSAAEEIYYDDYIESPKAVSAEGVLEIVSLSGTTYIHAIDVGSGSVKFSDGSVETYSVKKAQLDVYLLIGQSNAAYRPVDITAENLELTTKTKPGTAYFYGYETPIVVPDYSDYRDLCVVSSMNDVDRSQKVSNVDAPLAASIHENTGNKVLIINGAIGGTSVRSWIPGGTSLLKASDVYNDALNRIDEDLFDVTVRSYIWIQGEADGTMPVVDYETYYRSMHNEITSAYGVFYHALDAGFISITPGTHGNNSTIAQMNLVNSSDKSIIFGSDLALTFTIEDGTLKSDNLHYSQIGDNLLGSDIGKQIGDYYKK